jgi:uncharacterized caspase-like protein
MPKDWAIIIGINRYRHWSRLKNAVADAKAMRNILVSDYGFHHSRVRLLLDQHATKTSLLRLINHTIPHRWDVGTNDQLLLFFAGHSGRAKRNHQKPWYLAMMDSQHVNSGSSTWDTVLTRDEVRVLESNFRGRHIFYIFDSCYSGLVFSAQAHGEDHNVNKIGVCISSRPRRRSSF